MVETRNNKNQYYNELEWMNESELETIIFSDPCKADDARYVLGKLQIEGSFPENVPLNETKGVSWLKTASKNGHLLALEHLTNWEIRFGKQPNINKIQKNLEQVVEQGKSTRACNTLGEFAHAQSRDSEENKKLAAKYYQMSSEMGCLIGKHWSGVFSMEGFGVSKNLDKAIDLLTQAAKMGNAQSSFQLFMLYSQVEEKKDPVLAYKNLSQAVTRGVTFFDQMNAYFKEHYDVLAPVFLETKKPIGVTIDDQA